MSVRDDLAAAACDFLGDNKVSAKYRQTSKTGDGWVSFGRRDRDSTGLGFMDTWQIRIVTGQDLADAEQWTDDNAEGLTAALAEHLVITSVLPVTLVMDTGNIPGLIIEGVRPN